jgi:predicted RND superfamily exporter protein
MIRFRLMVLVLLAAVTVGLGWKIGEVRVNSETTDLFPSDHPYVETFMKYKDIFGGANTALIVVEVKDGDIFNVPMLQKIKEITKEVELLPGINNYQVLSLAQRKVKDITVDFTPEGPLFKAEPVMWPEVPTTPEGIERLKEVVYSSPRIFGTLVSKDSKAALVVAGFLDNELDPPKLWLALEEMEKKYEDGNTQMYIIGRPVMLGQIWQQMGLIRWLLLATLAAVVFTLIFYFRDFRGVMIPLATAVVSAVWGLGFIGWLGYNFDPLVIVVPFVISARGLSHSVQLIERYMEEIVAGKERKVAAVDTFAGLFSPTMVSIVADAICVFLVAIATIPLMQKLAVMGGFWILTFIFSDLVMNPVVLSLLPVPKHPATDKATMLDRLLGWVGEICVGRGRYAVLVVTAVVGVVGYLAARTLVIGDVHPGTPMLWPDSRYNKDTDHIAQKFGNTEQLNVIVEGKECPEPPREELLEEHGCADDLGTCYDAPDMTCTQDEECFGCDVAAGTCKTDRGRKCAADLDCVSRECNPIKSPVVLQNIESFQRYMETLPEVGSSMSVAGFLPSVIGAMHANDPKWEIIPRDRRDAGFFLGMIFSSSEPGDLSRYVTQDAKRATITLYLEDHKGETLRKVVHHAKKFIESHPMDEAEFLLASGYGGLLAAVNEIITRADFIVTLLAFLTVFICCALAYWSIVAGILFLVPLLVSNYVTYAVMGALEIGLDVNALPVVTLGIGLGVDYGLYIVSRIQEEYAVSHDMAAAIRRAVTTAGKAVVFTATTMVAGIIPWAWSFLKFQADMGILLAVWMCVSMLGGLILLPVLVYLIRPRFVTSYGATAAPVTK